MASGLAFGPCEEGGAELADEVFFAGLDHGAEEDGAAGVGAVVGAGDVEGVVGDEPAFVVPAGVGEGGFTAFPCVGAAVFSSGFEAGEPVCAVEEEVGHFVADAEAIGGREGVVEEELVETGDEFCGGGAVAGGGVDDGGTAFFGP